MQSCAMSRKFAIYIHYACYLKVMFNFSKYWANPSVVLLLLLFHGLSRVPESTPFRFDAPNGFAILRS